MSTLEARVQRGFEWLLIHVPSHVIADIDLTDLDMQSEESCVLGQTVGWDTEVRTSEDREWARDHGFDAEDASDDDEYYNLTVEWRDVLGNHLGFRQ